MIPGMFLVPGLTLGLLLLVCVYALGDHHGKAKGPVREWVVYRPEIVEVVPEHLAYLAGVVGFDKDGGAFCRRVADQIREAKSEANRAKVEKYWWEFSAGQLRDQLEKSEAEASGARETVSRLLERVDELVAEPAAARTTPGSPSAGSALSAVDLEGWTVKADLKTWPDADDTGYFKWDMSRGAYVWTPSRYYLGDVPVTPA